MTRTSVIVPTYDRAPLLGAALDSVLVQCREGDEVIVVDDGSTDGTSDLLARYTDRIVVLRQRRGGPAAARNLGLAAAGGELVAFLDSDDFWDERHRSALHRLLDDDPSHDLAFGAVLEFADGPLGRREIRRMPGACCGALLARRSVFTSVGPFQTGFCAGEFIDWMARARRCGVRESRTGDIVLHRRSHAGNMTRQAELATAYAAVLRAHLARGDGP